MPCQQLHVCVFNVNIEIEKRLLKKKLMLTAEAKLRAAKGLATRATFLSIVVEGGLVFKERKEKKNKQNFF